MAFLTQTLLSLLIGWQIACTTSQKAEARSMARNPFLKRLKRAGPLVETLPSFPQIRNAFLEKHNSLRRSVSPSASDMQEVSWDDELEQLAKDNSAKCTFAHSKKPRTKKFKKVGESIHIGLIDPLNIPNLVTQLWFDEVKYYNYNKRTCRTGKNCDHYLQIVWANTYQIGCGISTCNGLLETGAAGLITICNYAPLGLGRTIENGVNMQNFPYQTGVPCSACSKGLGCNKGLCSNVTTTIPTK